jgi:hypothetical protein
MPVGGDVGVVVVVPLIFSPIRINISGPTSVPLDVGHWVTVSLKCANKQVNVLMVGSPGVPAEGLAGPR